MTYRDDESSRLHAENARLRDYVEADKIADAKREKHVARLEAWARGHRKGFV